MDIKVLNEVNDRLKKTDIKGKDYVEVNQRILAFWELFPGGSIETEILSLENGVVTMKATVKNNGAILSIGHAQEKESSSYINKTSFIENCETSAVGRALGILGIGATSSVASAEEVLNAINNQGKPAGKPITPPSKEILAKAEELGITLEKVSARFKCSPLEVTDEQLKKAISMQEEALAKINSKKENHEEN